MLNMDKTFICLTIGLLAINTVIEATNVTPICQPFSAFFLWHTGFGEDSSFFLHRRLLIESITQLPENTNVSIVTFGAENNLSLNFTKQAGDTNWRDTILNYMPGNDLNYGLSNKEINQTISNHYRINKSSKAEIVYILVSDRTEILDEESDHEAFRIKKTFMILSGIQTMSKTNYWLKQATNEHHFVEFYRDEDIKKTVDAILVVSCQDSKFVCDTHMYWWYEKGRCNTCTYICVKSCSKRSEYCNRACPCATEITTQCKPFSPLFLWHTGTGEDSSFFLHRRLLIMSIRKLPENTDVSIATFGAEINLTLKFTKQAGHTNWRDTIMNYTTGNASNHLLSNREINQAISYHCNNDESSKVEIVYILVNNKTEIHDTENNFEELRKKKRIIIISGIQTTHSRDIWLKLAINERHFVDFDRDEDIKKTVEDILMISCQDSMFICDTDMYWWYEKGRCNTCTYICSKSCTLQPEFCIRACPYFRQYEVCTKTATRTGNFRKPLHENTGSVISVVFGMILIIIFLFVAYKKFERLVWRINSSWRRITGH